MEIFIGIRIIRMYRCGRPINLEFQKYFKHTNTPSGCIDVEAN